MQVLDSATNSAGGCAADCARDVITHLPPLMNFIRRHMRQRRAAGLSLPQFRVLVRAEHKATVSDVAYFLGTSLPTASRVVSGLVGKGLIARQSVKDDRRCCRLALTSKGQAALKDALDGARNALAVELGRLNRAECVKFSESLRKVAALFAE